MAVTSAALVQAQRHHQAGDLQQAVHLYEQVLREEPGNGPAWYLLGMAFQALGMLPEAASAYQESRKLRPGHVESHHYLGIVFFHQQRFAESRECFRQALALNPHFAEAHSNLGAVCQLQGQSDLAVACLREAIRLKPDFADAHKNLGLALAAMGNKDEARMCFQQALRVRPTFVEAQFNLAMLFEQEGLLAEAAAAYRQALRLDPGYVKAHNNLGLVCEKQGQLEEAKACYQEALRLNPDLAEVHNNLGNVLKEHGQLAEAIARFQRAVQLKPDLAAAHNNLGNALKDHGQLAEAIASCERAYQLKPDNPAILGQLVHQLQHGCLWKDLKNLSQRAIELVATEASHASADSMSPFHFLALPTPTTANQQHKCACHWVQHRFQPSVPSSQSATSARLDRFPSRITLGYLSADFREHPVACLISELLEKHDRDRFTVFGYSIGPDDHSPMRRRLVKAFDQVIDLRNASFEEAARRITAGGVDILVDLMGHTSHARTQILALRPAPVQVNYLGYPGTMGAPFMDYILVDDFSVPFDQQPYYTEKLVHLPGCFQVNDSQRVISRRTPTRAECGLPEEGFVFCCFNNTYKITPEVFAVWMELVKAVPRSVLWLPEGNPLARATLRREAESQGVAASRLTFARNLPFLPDHLARYRLADLFLDTFPYNAHTTASDSLWAGCPVLTMAGQTFVSRVAGSLLRALDLPELITNCLDEYHEMAMRLAQDSGLLKDLRNRLEASRSTSRLFDARQFVRDLEKAYRTMWEINTAGDKPHAFAVDTDRPAECGNSSQAESDDSLHVEAHNSLGNALLAQGKPEEAVISYRQALRLRPDLAEVHYNLGNAFREQGNLEDAVASFEQALRLKPALAEAHNNLGNVLKEQGRLEEAVTSLQQAVRLLPSDAEAHNNLGNALKEQGRLEEAAGSYQQALRLRPGYAEAHSNLLLLLHYRSGITLGELAKAHAAYDQCLAVRLHSTCGAYANDRYLERRLRLGFVSPDLRRHPVGYFLVRVLECLDRGQAEVVCYSNRSIHDDMTDRFRAAATTWCDVAVWSDDRLATQIRADRIDILFDLAGHTGHNRLPVFARKPAPIQVTWAGYVGTTGLQAMDYLLADRYEVPAESEAYYRERVLRMPDGYVCYEPPSYAPPVAPLPARDGGPVTLGSFNNPAKFTPEVIAVWARVLQHLPYARLILKYKGLDDPCVSRRITRMFASHGIAQPRVACRGWSAHPDLLAQYHGLDLALDPFPFSGGLTTCEALWMGVPVITCPGQTFASRHALTHLSNIGLTETIASNVEEYVELVVSLARDVPRLAALREGLREQMAASPLCDGERFAANLMRLLRDAWRDWLASSSGAPDP